MAHNIELRDFLNKYKYSVEIVGPLGTQATCEIVESALISALRDTPKLADRIFNKISGTSSGRFRPLAIPHHLAERIMWDPLKRKDFTEATAKTGAILFVYVSKKRLNDRPGYDPGDLPSDGEIFDRVRKWWQLGHFLKEWNDKPESAPKLLVGVAGPKESRTIIASLRINTDRQGRWPSIEKEEKLQGTLQIPVNLETKLNRGLDFGGLRGRKIHESFGLTFDRGKPFEYQIFHGKKFLRSERKSRINQGSIPASE